jgi:SpoVK/Ycf46/Vps4 family AAA+-type ATPase
MTASAHVVQLVRAHYAQNEPLFASSAMALARGSKVPSVKAALINTLSAGRSSAIHRPTPAAPARPFQQAPRSHAQVSRLLQPLGRVAFDDLLLEPPIQAFLDEIVIELEYREELAARKLRARNRLLFWGPPGNGKTSSAAALGTALDVEAYGVSLPRTVSKYMGETGQNLGELFDSLTPSSLVVFDEIDAIGSARSDTTHSAGKEQNNFVNTILTLLDRCREGVIVATTNRPDILDPALLRRFDELVEFPAPSQAQMRGLAQKLCEGFGVPPVDVSSCANFDEVAKRCETEARRIVMREILAAEEAADDESDETEEEET